jgi:hypothetical protein
MILNGIDEMRGILEQCNLLIYECFEHKVCVIEQQTQYMVNTAYSTHKQR